VKFAPNSKSFAVGSMDHKIYLYNSETYRLKGTCDRHNSHIKEVNYSQDSMYIQSDSADNEHLYYEAEDGTFFSAGSQLRDIKWADWTCIYGWPLQGTISSLSRYSLVSQQLLVLPLLLLLLLLLRLLLYFKFILFLYSSIDHQQLCMYC